MKSKMTEKQAYKKPTLKTHGSIEQLTKGALITPVGSGGECPPGSFPVGDDLCEVGFPN